MAETFDVLLFELRGRRCALPASVVLEVMAPMHVTPVPLSGPAVRGVIPLHGQPVALIDLGDLINPASADRGQRGQSGPRGPGGWEEGWQENEPAGRAAQEATVVVEAAVPPEPGLVRAALAVDRILRVSSVEQPRSSPPDGTPFVSAAVQDSDGPALLIDIGAALARVMETVRAEVGGR